jgi:hypothetical protein
MSSLRRHLRFWATAWLVFQVASLSAYVPRNCCANHHPPAQSESEQSCHEATGAEAAVAESVAGHHHTAPTPDVECSLGGTCGGPMAALAALFANQGILTQPAPTVPELVGIAVPAVARVSLISRLASPDPPPPRA